MFDLLLQFGNQYYKTIIKSIIKVEWVDNMNKFVKISSIILIFWIISGILVRFTYGDMVDKKDYESRNVNEVIVEFESRKSVKEGN